jgi:hypothetical protein
MRAATAQVFTTVTGAAAPGSDTMTAEGAVRADRRRRRGSVQALGDPGGQGDHGDDLRSKVRRQLR